MAGIVTWPFPFPRGEDAHIVKGAGGVKPSTPRYLAGTAPTPLFSYQEGQDAHLTAQPGWSQTQGLWWIFSKSSPADTPKSVLLCA